MIGGLLDASISVGLGGDLHVYLVVDIVELRGQASIPQ